MNSLFQILGTLATMNLLFQKFEPCLRTLATMNSLFQNLGRLPALFSYNEFTFSKIWAPAGAL
jgi:hypothetical protein